MRCEHCQPLILDYLYGLLDGPEASAIESHLTDCAACAAARDEAARLQGLIARAAKTAFPKVRFEPVAKQLKSQVLPFAVPPSRSTEPTSRTSGTRRRGRTVGVSGWLPWAVAAAVLVAIPGTVFPVLNILERAAAARTQATAATARANRMAEETESARHAASQPLNEAIRNLAAAKQAHELLVSKWIAEQNALEQALNDRSRMAVAVGKPATLQPGAPNELLLTVLNQGSTPRGTVFAEVRDQTDAVIFSQKLDIERQGHVHPVRLPAETWTRLTPQSELFLVIASIDEKTGAKTELQEKVRLSGPVFTTVLTTDKPTYRPGETVFFRSLTLDRVTFQPPTHEQVLHFELHPAGSRWPVRGLTLTGGTDLVRIVDGRVEPLRGPDGKPLRGVGCGAFALPPDLEDGDYVLQLRELPHPTGYPPVVPFVVTRPIKVQSGLADVYQKRIGFARASFTPGDIVEAWAQLKLEGQPVSGVAVQVLATADGKKLDAAPLQPVTDADGRVTVRFQLPTDLYRADVRLRVTFLTRTGNDLREESVAERVPVIGRNLIVEFFPEGGNLVAGVPCRVYFRATTPDGVPADIRGTITDGRTDLARVETLTDASLPGANRGIGSFTYTPAIGRPVWLRLDDGAFTPLLNGTFPATGAAVAGAPAIAAVRSRFALPAPQIEGVVMTVPDPVTSPGQPIRVHLRSVGRERNLVVGAYTRGRLSDTQRVTARPEELAEVRLFANPDPRGGVVRITVFEELPEEPGQPRPDLKPVAERLVFRRPGEVLNLTVSPQGHRTESKGFLAGSPVDLTITATDEKGNPAAAILWAAAVNTGVAPGPKDRLITTHFLLAGEISTPDALEYADFLLTDHEKAAQALDLVLATQGWRRFAEQTPAPINRKLPPPSLERAVLQANSGQYGTWAEPTGLRERARIAEKYRPLVEMAQKQLAEAETNKAAIAADRTDEQRVQALAEQAEQARQEAAALAEQANAAEGPLQRFQRAGWYGVAGFGLLAVMLGLTSLTRPVTRLPLGIGTAGSLGLVAFLVFALGKAENVQAAAQPAELAQATNALPDPERSVAPATDQATELLLHKGVPVAPEPRASGAEKKREMMHLPKPEGPGSPPKPAAKDGDIAGGFGTAVVDMPTGAGGVGATFVPPAAAGVGGTKGATNKSDNMSNDTKSPPAGRPGNKHGGLADTGFLPGGGAGPAGMITGTPSIPAVPPTPSLTSPPLPPPTRGGWQPGLSGQVIRDAELESRGNFWSDTAKPRRASASTTAPYGPAAPPEVKDEQGDNRLADEYARQRANAAVEQLHRALAAKQSISVEELKARLNELSARFQDGKAFPPPPRPPFVPGRDKAPPMPIAPPTDELALFRVQVALMPITPLVVREYAVPRPGSSEALTLDSPDTILWQPVIVLPGDGKTRLGFNLGAAPGGYEMIVAGHTLDGRIGAVRELIPVAVPGQTGQSAVPGSVPPPMR